MLARMQAFMKRTTHSLVSSLYPGAPQERKYFAIEMLNAVLSAWGDGASAPSASAPRQAASKPGTALSAPGVTPRGYHLPVQPGGRAGSGGDGQERSVLLSFNPYCQEMHQPNLVSLLLAGEGHARVCMGCAAFTGTLNAITSSINIWLLSAVPHLT